MTRDLGTYTRAAAAVCVTTMMPAAITPPPSLLLLLMIVRDPEAPGYASVQPRQLAECRRCLAVDLLERRTEVAVAREAEGQCQVSDVVVVAQQV
jgi:hypothetical protein